MHAYIYVYLCHHYYTYIRYSHWPQTYGTVLRLPTLPEFGRQFNPILRSGRIQRWVTFMDDIFNEVYQHNVHAYVYVYLRHHCYTSIRNSHRPQTYGTVLRVPTQWQLRLKKLTKLLRVNAIGTAHFAGSESLLTASVYAKMNVILKIEPKIYQRFLYGLWYPIQGFQGPVRMVDAFKITHSISAY